MKRDPAELFRKACREDFLTFVSLAFAVMHPGTALKITWYHRAIANALMATVRGETQHVAICLPPRMLKSMIVSVFWPAWVIGLDPTMLFVCVSYSGDLAEKLALDCMTLMQSTEFKLIFPEVAFRKTAVGDFVTTKGGGRLATSFDGTTTGRGGNFVIIDDPMKPEDATSEAVREKINRTYSTTLISRRNPNTKGAMIIVGHRVHEDDLIGRKAQGPEWSQLVLGATAYDDETVSLDRRNVLHRKAGDLLDPERLPQKFLDSQKRNLGTAAYMAQYEQRPVPAEGNLFKRPWFAERYKYLPPKQPGDRDIVSLDPASKTGINNDFSAFVIVRRRGERYYVIDVIRKRLEFTDLLSEVQLVCERYRPDSLLIEDTSSGQALIQHLARLRPSFVPAAIACKPTKEKAVRIDSISPYAERGDIILPADAPWLEGFELELFGYPNAKHDDAVDAIAQIMVHASLTRYPLVAPLVVEKSAPPKSFTSAEAYLEHLETSDLSDEFDQDEYRFI